METPKRETSFAAGASGLGQRQGQTPQAANKVSDQTYDSSRVTIGTRQYWVTGTFTDRASAERAYHSMLSRGYGEKEINLMMSDETRKQYFSDENATEMESGNKA